MPCAPPAEAIVPWLRIATENVTVWPAAGLLGVQHDRLRRPGRSSGTWPTTSEVGWVYALLASLCSMTVLLSSTLALSW